MKKVFTILIAAVLLLSLVVGAAEAQTITQNAFNITGEDLSETSTVNVTLDVASEYSITLPSDFVFSYDDELGTYTSRSTEISASLKTFDHDYQLNVTVNGKTNTTAPYLWNLTCTDIGYEGVIAYYYMSNATAHGDHIEDDDIIDGTGLVQNGWSVLTTSESFKEKYIHLRLMEIPSHSGTYKSEVTFTVSLEQIRNNNNNNV